MAIGFLSTAGGDPERKIFDYLKNVLRLSDGKSNLKSKKICNIASFYWTKENFAFLTNTSRSRSNERQPLMVKLRSRLNLSSSIFCLECKLNILLNFILRSLNLVHIYLLLLCAFKWMAGEQIPSSANLDRIPLETFDLSRA